MAENSISEFDAIEKYRNSQRRILKINLIIFLLVLGVGIPYLTTLDYQTDKGLFVGTFLLIAFAFFRHIASYIWTYQRYEKYFRNNVLDKIIPIYFSGFDYTPEKKQEPEYANQSGLFEGIRFDYVKSQNLINGSTNKGKIEYSKLILKTIDRDSQSKSEFSGGYILAEINPVSSPVFVYPKVQGFALEVSSFFSLVPKEPLVEVGSSEFKKMFNVYSASEDVAKSILTPSVQAIFLSQQKDQLNRFGFKASFINDTLFLSMEKYDDFILDLKKSVKDVQMLKEMLMNLDEQIQFVDSLRG